MRKNCTPNAATLNEVALLKLCNLGKELWSVHTNECGNLRQLSVITIKRFALK